MEEKIKALLSELEAAKLSARALRLIKRQFRLGVDDIIQRTVGTPALRKQRRLEERAQKALAELAKHKAKNPSAEVE